MSGRADLWLALALAVGSASCAGDGSALGGVLEPGDGEDDAPTLSQLQTDIFTPFCSPCHQPGGIGPMPLDTLQASFDNLVGVESVEIAGLLRVAPGDPEMSYLVWKVEGRPTIVGDPMPLGGPMLAAEQIEAIVAWIAAGAEP